MAEPEDSKAIDALARRAAEVPFDEAAARFRLMRAVAREGKRAPGWTWTAIPKVALGGALACLIATPLVIAQLGAPPEDIDLALALAFGEGEGAIGLMGDLR